MEMAVTRVERTDMRKIKMTTTAKPSPSRPSTVRSWMDFTMKGAWSRTVVNLVLLPMDAAMPGSTSATCPESVTVSASGFLVIESARVALPLVRVMEVVGSSARETVATEAMVGAVADSSAPEGRPEEPPGMGELANGSALTASNESTGLPAWMDKVMPSGFNEPIGTRVPLLLRALAMEPEFTPAAAILAGSGRISMCWELAPLTSALRTPSIFKSLGTAMRARSVFSAARSWSEETARNTMGKSAMLPAMGCGTTPAGRRWLTLEMARSISFRARSKLVP